MSIFHLAIPTHDLKAAEHFYVDVIGAVLCRQYSDRITLNFFDHQVVCHLSNDGIVDEPKIYPRHFGITFTDFDLYQNFYSNCLKFPQIIFREKNVRWPDRPEKHETFFLKDPSNNVLEFKYYYSDEFIY